MRRGGRRKIQLRAYVRCLSLPVLTRENFCFAMRLHHVRDDIRTPLSEAFSLILCTLLPSILLLLVLSSFIQIWSLSSGFLKQKIHNITMAPKTSLIGYLILLSCSLTSLVNATITVGDKHFQSMPAVFGKPFSLVGSYDTAHLQLIEDNPFLCQTNNLDSLNERHLRANNETTHIVPTDGLPGEYIL